MTETRPCHPDCGKEGYICVSCQTFLREANRPGYPDKMYDTHKVKSWCYLYSAAIAGYKTHDFRDMTERDYKVGDHMHFQEFDQTKGTYTGREALFQITYITDRNTPCAMSSCALEKKYGVLSIKLLKILFPAPAISQL